MSCTKRQACLGEWSSSGAGLSSRSTNVLLWSSTAMRWRPPGPRRPRRHPRRKGSQLMASQLPCSPGDTAQHPGATPRRRRLNGSSLLKTNLPAASLCVSSAHKIPSAGTLAISPAERSTTSPKDRVLHPLGLPLMFPSSLQTAHECESSRRSAQILH